MSKRVGLLKVELFYKLQRFGTALAQIRTIESQLNYLYDHAGDISPTSSEVEVVDLVTKSATELVNQSFGRKVVSAHINYSD